MCRVFAIAIVAIGLLTNGVFAQRGDGRRFRSDDRQERRESTTEKPLTPGFGEGSTLPAVPGFGAAADSAASAGNRGVTLEDRFHPKVVAYVDQVLRRYDRNSNGKLEREEWTAARWRSDPVASDLNKDGILTREELCERVKTYDEFRGLDSSSTSAGGSSGAPASDKAKLEEYAKGLMRRYDKNDNGVLEADEYQQMSSFHRGADLNGDNVITRDELAARLANYGNTSNDPTSSPLNTDRPSDERSASSSPSSKSYRAPRGYRRRSLSERLPKDLPDWFIRNDADGDGQISMAEFSVMWTEEKLEEFVAHDSNGDGLITPQECLDAARHRRDTGATPWRSRGR